MSNIHVCLVSGQPIPNLIPLKMEGLTPHKVILLVSPDMAVQPDRIEKVIKSWKVAVERHPIAPYDLESARKTCLDILATIEDNDVTLNVTGGTKIMALAAFEVFREDESDGNPASAKQRRPDKKGIATGKARKHGRYEVRREENVIIFHGKTQRPHSLSGSG